MLNHGYGKQHPCFWAFSVPPGLYGSTLAKLNLRTLGIVFNLEGTLLVANTIKSFEEKIEVLKGRMTSEADPQCIASMLRLVERYEEDKDILKQYAKYDQIVQNGIIFKSKAELVLPLSDPVIHPLIRLHDKNIILTRINPQIPDTSVLVRLRPAWEHFRRYLNAAGRKRFEVCTMGERDYALEMWRLLDPEENLIRREELFDHMVCVKAGFKKSLSDVFQARMHHPKMTLILDDQLEVWNGKDQPRVHVLLPYAPYHAPQAKDNIPPPILCIARSVACYVRLHFFKAFDEGLLKRIPEVAYEDDMKDIPPPPDVSDSLLAQDDAVGKKKILDSFNFYGLADVEAEKGLSVPEKYNIDSHSGKHLVMSQHGHDIRELSPSEPPIYRKPSLQVTLPQAYGSLAPSKEQMNPRLNKTGMECHSLEAQPLLIHENQRVNVEIPYRDEWLRSNYSLSHHQPQPSSIGGLSMSGQLSTCRELDFQSHQEDPLAVLEEVTRKSGAKVDFRLVLGASREMYFHVEASSTVLIY